MLEMYFASLDSESLKCLPKAKSSHLTVDGKTSSHSMFSVIHQIYPLPLESKRLRVRYSYMGIRDPFGE